MQHAREIIIKNSWCKRLHSRKGTAFGSMRWECGHQEPE